MRRSIKSASSLERPAHDFPTQKPLAACELSGKVEAGNGQTLNLQLVTCNHIRRHNMVKVIALLNRKPGMTREAFKRRWLDEHLKLSSQIPNLLGYYVNIAIDHQPDGDGVQPIYDGTAELWFKDIETMEA